MKKCYICKKEADKYIDCLLISKPICMTCCFAVSTGKKELIQTLRLEFELSKDDILKGCSKCLEKSGGIAKQENNK